MNNPANIALPPFEFHDRPGWRYCGWISREAFGKPFAYHVEDWSAKEDQHAEVYPDGAVCWKEESPATPEIVAELKEHFNQTP